MQQSSRNNQISDVLSRLIDRLTFSDLLYGNVIRSYVFCPYMAMMDIYGHIWSWWTIYVLSDNSDWFNSNQGISIADSVWKRQKITSKSFCSRTTRLVVTFIATWMRTVFWCFTRIYFWQQLLQFQLFIQTSLHQKVVTTVKSSLY